MAAAAAVSAAAAEEFPHSDSLFRSFLELVMCVAVAVCVCVLVLVRGRDKMTQRHFSDPTTTPWCVHTERPRRSKEDENAEMRDRR